MHLNEQTDHNRNLPRQTEHGTPLGRLALAGGVTFAVCAFLASLVPPPLFAAALSSLLSTAGFIAAGAAVLHSDQLSLTRFNNWDLALALMGLSILTGWFVDLDAVRAYAEAQGVSDAAATVHTG